MCGCWNSPAHQAVRKEVWCAVCLAIQLVTVMLMLRSRGFVFKHASQARLTDLGLQTEK